MLTPRRFLPQLAHLQAFEAAARLGSVTAAAREMNLTQSAVSRQIKALEDQLEVELFHRERQTIRLTPGGEAYARDIRDALKRISTASLNLMTRLSVFDFRLEAMDAAIHFGTGDWPGAEARLWLEQTRWSGVGDGYGRLRERSAQVGCRRGTAPAQFADWPPLVETPLETSRERAG